MDFRILNRSDYELILRRWEEEAESHAGFPGEVGERLLWIAKALDAGDSHEAHRILPYGAFMDGQQLPVAVCELVLSRKSKDETWLKLLRVILSPEVEALVEARDPDAVQSAVAAYRAAILGAYACHVTHSANVVKLYGRNDDILSFLDIMLSHAQDAEFDGKIEGRWLVLTPKSTNRKQA